MKRMAPFFFLALSFVFSARDSAQFRDDFGGPSIRLGPSAKKGWTFFNGGQIQLPPRPSTLDMIWF